ncbi:DNA-binding protein [Acinetobacter sp. ANC 4470]|uniref:NirD/YgiW/YdeI family stress tolerance protein n=1 Tax=Acinetobacter sp. ANC 4470 TaxID=1977881 RepID=UPI000A355857|nr:NirD/YgiW/YdeI family stress tolerance protein [Acinetobacter sp. ANC 4470]OTG66860.1 DNA-binding protein [Acinetobacter sp. ANC 4470]
MHKILMVILFTSSICTTVTTWAGKDDHIIIQEAASNQVKVADVKNLKDETAVTLTGTLLKHLKQEHYEFNDGTGLILLEIDDDIWKSAAIQVGDKIKVIGEVDKHRYKPTDIEVVKIEKVMD